MTTVEAFKIHADPSSADDFLDLREDVFVLGEPGDIVIRFDREGRWFHAGIGSYSYRLGQNGRVSVQQRATRDGRTARSDRWLTSRDADLLTERIRLIARSARDRLQRGRKKLLRNLDAAEVEAVFDRIEAWTPERFQMRATRFREIYGAVPILPSDHYFSLYLQLVVGCSYNRCTFCTFHRETKYRLRTISEWRDHLVAVRDYFGRSLSLRRDIFLGDANSLAVDQDELVERFRIMREIFPATARGMRRIHAFIDTFSRRNQGREDYKELAAFGLKRVYAGVETGHDPLRILIQKPGDAEQVLDRLRRIKSAGVSVGLMVLTGVGGRTFQYEHLRDTLALIQKAGLGTGDIIFLSRLKAGENSDYAQLLKQNKIEPLSAMELAVEETRFCDGMPSDVAVARYEVDGFVY